MIIPLIIGATVIGGGVYFFNRKKDLPLLPASLTPTGKPTSQNTSPSSKQWPGNITTDDTTRAVNFALTNETNASALRAFAGMLERYDPSSSTALLDKANKISPQKSRLTSFSNAGISRTGRLT